MPTVPVADHRPLHHHHDHVISDDHVTDFLTANSPSFGHFSTELRESARDFLQRQLEVGELTNDHLVEYHRAAVGLSPLTE